MTYFILNSLNHIHLSFDLDSELLKYIFLDIFRELYDLSSCSTSIIYEYKCLFLMNTRISDSFSFPSSLFDEPTSGKLHNIWFFGRIRRHFWILSFQRIEMFKTNERILKKTTSISHDFWVWKLALSNRDNNLRYIGWSRSCDFSRIQLSFYRSVFKI